MKVFYILEVTLYLLHVTLKGQWHSALARLS